MSNSKIEAGVAGLGLMGASIAACLLHAGHPVVAFSIDVKERRTAKSRVRRALRELESANRLNEALETLMARLRVSDDYADFGACAIVIESVVEDLMIKRDVLARIEARVRQSTLLLSNTSALPISLLQSELKYPQRMLGMHWAEPAQWTHFMEIVCGERTRLSCAQRALKLARGWGKEPILVKRDVRGFVANRIGYAMYREAFALVEAGVATPHDIDLALRHSIGVWLGFCGPFRFMDLTGLAAYEIVMRELWPELSCATESPETLRALIESGARGVGNGRGFYEYSAAEARRWETEFRAWNRATHEKMAATKIKLPRSKARKRRENE